MDDEIKFKKAVCPYCGAVLDIEKIDKITVCEYCDGKILTDEFEILAKNSEENIAPDSDYKIQKLAHICCKINVYIFFNCFRGCFYHKFVLQNR